MVDDFLRLSGLVKLDACKKRKINALYFQAHVFHMPFVLATNVDQKSLSSREANIQVFSLVESEQSRYPPQEQ